MGNAYPLPDITEILDQLGQSKYFSCLDLAMGYHQTDMGPSDVDKTAFGTEEGHWAYKRMPFGTKTGPATLQRMTNVLSGLTGTRCFVFLDDNVIYANSVVNHDRKLNDVFRRLRKYLKLQSDKCEFFEKRSNLPRAQNFRTRSRTQCSQDRMHQEFPKTKDGEITKEFSCLTVYYRNFVPQFSKIASPLHKLLKRGAKYV